MSTDSRSHPRVITAVVSIFFMLPASNVLFAEQSADVKFSLLTGEASLEVPPGSHVVLVQPPVAPATVVATNNFASSSQMQQHQQPTTIITQTLPDQLRRAGAELCDRSLSLVHFTKQYLSHYKWRCAGLCLLSLYGGVCGRLLYLRHQLAKTNWWSAWRGDLALSELFNLDEIRLIDELLTSIQERYTTLATIDDFNVPVVSFLDEVAKEKKLLRAYRFWSRVVPTSGYAGLLFPVNSSLLKTIEQRLDRLSFLQSRVVHYLSVSKVQQHRARQD